MNRDVLTIASVYKFRDDHPVGSTVRVPIERNAGEPNHKRIHVEYRNAIVIEPHKRVVVTTAGTFRWTQLALAERGVCIDDDDE